MRCGRHLISDGKSTRITLAEIQHKCGEPYDKAHSQWLYVRRDVVSRVYFNRNREVIRIKSEIVR